MVKVLVPLFYHNVSGKVILSCYMQHWLDWHFFKSYKKVNKSVCNTRLDSPMLCTAKGSSRPMGVTTRACSAKQACCKQSTHDPQSFLINLIRVP